MSLFPKSIRICESIVFSRNFSLLSRNVQYADHRKCLLLENRPDRSIFIWTTKDWYINDHKNSRVNIEFDHACLIRWSPDSKGFIVRKVNENILEAYKINKRNDGRIVGAVKVFTYPKLHSDEIIGLGISSNGKYIMSCSNDTVIISDVKGSILARIDTLLTDTYDARLSPCGKFVAASGLAPEAKTWEVQFSKTGEFTEIVEAFNLEGHDAGIHQTAFTNDTSRMGTISKDGTWRLYDIRVEYQKDEKPRLLQTARYEQDETEISRIALSPNGNVVAAACGSSLFLYNADTGEIDSTINDIFPGPITRILFDDEGKYILVSGYKHVHIFHNVTGLRAVAAFATNKLNDRNLTSATRERLEKQISDAEAFIASLEK